MSKDLKQTITHFTALLAEENPGEIDLDELRECLEEIGGSMSDGPDSKSDGTVLRRDIVCEILRLCKGADALRSSGERSSFEGLTSLLMNSSDEDLLRYRNNARRNFSRLNRMGSRPYRTLPNRSLTEFKE